MKKLEKLAPEVYSLGRKLGYPECCIDFFALRMLGLMAFGTRVPIPDNYRLVGTGFIPCPMCNATKTEEQLVEEIGQNRAVDAPFPEFEESGEWVLVEAKEEADA